MGIPTKNNFQLRVDGEQLPHDKRWEIEIIRRLFCRLDHGAGAWHDPPSEGYLSHRMEFLVGTRKAAETCPIDQREKHGDRIRGIPVLRCDYMLQHD